MNISVIITTYNRFNECKRSINSVLNQIYKPIEIIVIEDASSSGIENWIRENNLNVKYIKNERNLGLAGSRNKGLKLARGEWIAYLDDDDEWLPNRLEEQVKEFERLKNNEKEKICVIQCGNETIDEKGNLIGYYLPQNCGNLQESIKKIGAKTPSSAFLFRKNVLEKMGGFSEDLISGIDHDIWMKLAINNCYNLCVKKPLVRIYKEPIETMMTNTNKRILGIKQYVDKWEEVYKNWFGEKEGMEYKRNYFSEVISGLVAQKILSREFKDAFVAFKSILQMNKYFFKSLKYFKLIFLAILREELPYKAKQFLKRFK